MSCNANHFIASSVPLALDSGSGFVCATVVVGSEQGCMSLPVITSLGTSGFMAPMDQFNFGAAIQRPALLAFDWREKITCGTCGDADLAAIDALLDQELACGARPTQGDIKVVGSLDTGVGMTVDVDALREPGSSNQSSHVLFVECDVACVALELNADHG
jgi:hypothetical protein